MVNNSAKYKTPKAVEDCRDLLLWIIPHLDKLPKNRRYTIGEKLENRLLVVLENLVESAYSRNKRLLLQKANLNLEVSRHLWRLCHDFQAVSHKSYAHGSKLMKMNILSYLKYKFNQLEKAGRLHTSKDLSKNDPVALRIEWIRDRIKEGLESIKRVECRAEHWFETEWPEEGCP